MDNLAQNPFSAPPPENLRDSNQQRVIVDFVPIIYRWERMRIVYNAVLIILTALESFFIGPQLMLDPLFLLQVCVGGLISNLCFFTGPAIEGYGRYLGFWNLTLSISLFACGLVFTGLLSLGFIIVRSQ